MTGFIFLDKPGGITSFIAVNRVRKICSVKKAGHTGTLDPMATGVLPIMLGGATRFSQYIPVHDKSYRAEILLGTVTDTLDTTGTVLETNQVNVSSEQLHNVVSSFVGDINQLPPMYSAVSKNGVRLYKLARQGIEIEREARKVTIYNADIIDELHNNRFTIDVTCSCGTYIRSLAADIGNSLGCGAVISQLRRTQANGISISETVTLEELRELADSGDISSVVTSCDKILECYPEVYVSEKQAVRFENGGELDIVRLKHYPDKGLCRVYSPQKKLLGLGNVSPEEEKLFVEKKLVYD